MQYIIENLPDDLPPGEYYVQNIYLSSHLNVAVFMGPVDPDNKPRMNLIVNEWDEENGVYK